MDLAHLQQVTRYDSIIKLIRQLGGQTDLEAICRTFAKFWPLITDLPIFGCLVFNEAENSYIGILDGQIVSDTANEAQQAILKKYSSPQKLTFGTDPDLEGWLFPKFSEGTAEIYVTRLESIKVQLLYGFAAANYPFPALDKKFAQMAFFPLEQAVLIHFQEHLLKLSAELEKAKERAEQEAARAIKADQVKTNFLANMSHELRTPLNAVLGLSRLLLEGSDLVKDQKEPLETIAQNAIHLLNLVRDILDFTQIETQEVRLESMPCNLKGVLENTFSANEHLASEKYLTFVKDFPDAFPPTTGDPIRLASVCNNLISNAIKYTSKGQVTVKGSYVFEKDDQNFTFILGVTDTGMGISEEHQTTIFEKFNQVDNSTTRKFGGTGLGLALSKQLVELMGGTISVQSKLGEGAHFEVRIPFLQAQEKPKTLQEEGAPPTLQPDTVRVLIAEDNPMNQMVVKKALERLGILNPTVAENGAIAVKEYVKTPYDLILMDCQMPEMSGYDATINIRNVEKSTGAHAKIVAVTANAMIEDREKCFACGMDDFLGKPYKVKDLKEILSRWIIFPEEQASA